VNEYWQQIWGSRSPRERKLIAGGGGFALLILLYLYVWQPISMERHRLRERLPELRVAAAQMQRDAAEATRLKALAAAKDPARAKRLPSGGVQSVVEQSAGAAGLRDKIKTISSVDGNHVKVAFGGVPFDQWIGWVANLQSEQGIRLDSVSVDALPDAGKVNLQSVLSGAAH
jgi:general secretion pathway protein M